MGFGILEACHNVLDWKASEAEYEISVLVTGMFFSVAYFLYFLILLWRSMCLLVRYLPALYDGFLLYCGMLGHPESNQTRLLIIFLLHPLLVLFFVFLFQQVACGGGLVK